MPSIPCVLTIAGSDPCGASGIQSDLQVIRDFDLYGASAITAIVWQNTQGVGGWSAVGAQAVARQAQAVLDDLDVRAIKIGMLPDAQTVEAVAQVVAHARAQRAVSVVCDPVLASGDARVALAGAQVVEAMKAHLFAHVDVLTPNIPEAMALDATSLSSPSAKAAAMARALKTGVLLKAGHWEQGEGDHVLRDWWSDPEGQVHELEALPRIPDDVRGTGCQLSSAIACGLAQGLPAVLAIEGARAYLQRMLQLRARPGLGRMVVVRAAMVSNSKKRNL